MEDSHRRRARPVTMAAGAGWWFVDTKRVPQERCHWKLSLGIIDLERYISSHFYLSVHFPKIEKASLTDRRAYGVPMHEHRLGQDDDSTA
jgi:hypothetical protein